MSSNLLYKGGDKGNWEQSCASSVSSNLLYKGAENNNLHSCNNVLKQRTILHLRILLECEHSDCSISPPSGIRQRSAEALALLMFRAFFSFFPKKRLWTLVVLAERERGSLRECVLFIGTWFSNLYTAVDTPARGRVGVCVVFVCLSSQGQSTSDWMSVSRERE